MVDKAHPAFSDWWAREGDWVEEPNERRDGNSGVQRLTDQDVTLYLKRQIGHLSRSLRYPLGRPTVVREAWALEAYRAAGVRVPQIRFAGARKHQRGLYESAGAIMRSCPFWIGPVALMRTT